MTTIERDSFKRILEDRQSELGTGFRKREDLAIEASPDDLDRIQQASDHDYVVGNLERNAGQLREVRAALERIDAGTFGVCSGCEEHINRKRLAAVPWASFCILCQQAVDLGLDPSRSDMNMDLVRAA
jgi:RNA polymerase-binding protein DksA